MQFGKSTIVYRGPVALLHVQQKRVRSFKQSRRQVDRKKYALSTLDETAPRPRVRDPASAASYR